MFRKSHLLDRRAGSAGLAPSGILLAMHIAVLIVGFRNADDLAGCLEALSACAYDNFEVVICENGGPEAFAALNTRVSQTLPGGQAVRTILAETNLGYAGGVNRCLAAAPDADAWWVLNPDTRAERDALGLMVERLSAGDVQAVGCTVYLPMGVVQSYGGRWSPWTGRSVSLGFGRPLSDPVDGDRIEQIQNYLSGASMMVNRAFLDTIGPMREDYFLYCEEVDWCLRASERGLRLGFAPMARVLHHTGTTTGAYDAIRQRRRLPIYLSARNAALLLRDHAPPMLPIAIPALLIQQTIKFGRHRAWRQLGFALSGLRDGLLNRRGPPSQEAS